MPGTTSNAMPASSSAWASSPPRPNTYGSPPFRRTTRRPLRARSTSSVEISSWGTGPAGALADVDQLGRRRHESQHAVADEGVVDDHVRRLQQPRGAGRSAGRDRPGRPRPAQTVSRSTRADRGAPAASARRLGRPRGGDHRLGQPRRDRLGADAVRPVAERRRPVGARRRTARTRAPAWRRADRSGRRCGCARPSGRRSPSRRRRRRSPSWCARRCRSRLLYGRAHPFGQPVMLSRIAASPLPESASAFSSSVTMSGSTRSASPSAWPHVGSAGQAIASRRSALTSPASFTPWARSRSSTTVGAPVGGCRAAGGPGGR